jgi:hypothetical protein
MINTANNNLFINKISLTFNNSDNLVKIYHIIEIINNKWEYNIKNCRLAYEYNLNKYKRNFQ